MKHVLFPYKKFKEQIQSSIHFIRFQDASTKLTEQVKSDTCIGFYKGHAIIIDYTR